MGYRRTFLQLQFQNVPDLLVVRRAILPIADANRKKMDAMDAYTEVVQYQPSVSNLI
jgi:DNA polymerase epsilon subunit 1